MNLAGITFRAVLNSDNDNINGDTEMHFTSDTEVVLGNYSGGNVRAGQVRARWTALGELEMLYHSARRDGSMATGQAQGRIEVDDTGTLRMHLQWKWLTWDLSEGESKWIQLKAN